MRSLAIVLACAAGTASALACAACSGGGGGPPGGAIDAAAIPVDAAPGTIELTQTIAFWLPINSERLGASGRAGDTCVGLVWDFSNLGMARTRHCDDFVDRFPYAIVRPSNGSPCGTVWDYAPDATVTGTRGCIDPDFSGTGTAHRVDVTAQITSPSFTGLVHLRVAP